MKKTIRVLLVIIVLLVLFLAAMIAVPHYLMGINIFDLSGWSHSDGQVQYLDACGNPHTGWQEIDGGWYYFSPEDGNMVTGWAEIGGKRYYLAPNGLRQTGWVELAEGKYYLSPSDAAALQGWQEIDGSTYYLDETGRVSTGLTEIEGQLYFLGADGIRRSGWVEENGKRYFLDEHGIITTGWVETEQGSSYLGPDGAVCSGWTDTPEGRFFLTEQGTITTGWVTTTEGRVYLNEQGLIHTGWLDAEDARYYLDENGMAVTGWQDLEGKRCYFHEDGRMAIGKIILDAQTYYFSSAGQLVPLVNKWNPLPEDYEVELTAYGSLEIAAEAYESLVGMIDQIKSLGYYKVTSIYRSKQTQQNIWDRYYNNFLAVGCSKAEAEKLTGEKVAVPGTSEHHLGYAVDIDGVKPVHNWLAEHSWEYGFIVRYPDGTTEITGIEYEPWHFRYVGRELAKELYDLGITLEEYMDMLTEKAGNGTGTASNPDVF